MTEISFYNRFWECLPCAGIIQMWHCSLMELILDTVKCKTQLQVKTSLAHICYNHDNYNLDLVPKISIQGTWGTMATTLLVHVGEYLFLSLFSLHWIWIYFNVFMNLFIFFFWGGSLWCMASLGVSFFSGAGMTILRFEKKIAETDPVYYIPKASKDTNTLTCLIPPNFTFKEIAHLEVVALCGYMDSWMTYILKVPHKHAWFWYQTCLKCFTRQKSITRGPGAWRSAWSRAS